MPAHKKIESFVHSEQSVRELLQNPLGRTQLKVRLIEKLWSAYRPTATWYRRRIITKTCLVAVVGSFGKTTTTRAVSMALNVPRRSTLIANARGFLAHAMLVIRPGDPFGVLEVGIGKPRQMKRYAKMVQPDIAVVTCIGSEHHDTLKTLENTRYEKSYMVKALPADGLAVLNGDDPNVIWMRERTKARILTFGMNEGNDVYASDIQLDWPTGMRFNLHLDGRVFPMHIACLGNHMVYPVLAAAAVAAAEGIPPEDIVSRLNGFPPTPNRMELIPLENGAAIILDARKSTIETLHSALATMDSIPAPRKILVLGAIFEMHKDEYDGFGEITAAAADHMVLMMPDKDLYDRFIEGTRRAGMADENIVHTTSVKAAIAYLRDYIRTGDAIPIKGYSKHQLERVALALQGRTVGCELTHCKVRLISCHTCPMLARGWENGHINA